jgi:FkbM family methyltransferase
MMLEVPVEDGAVVEFECADTWVSRWVCQTILEDKTYPHLPFIDDVQVVFDVGSNCGAAAVHFARLHPNAVVHAFEPGSPQRAILERNAAAYPNITVHPFGLAAHDALGVPLYQGVGDTIVASLHQRSDTNTAESEPVDVRAAGPWAASHAIDRIDIAKVDVEGCEVEVVESLVDLLPTVKVLYVEYDSRVARRQIDRLLDGSHELFYASVMALDQGEGIYVRNDLVDGEAQTAKLVELFRRGLPAP